MKKWLRRIRGAIGTGLTWVAWKGHLIKPATALHSSQQDTRGSSHAANRSR